ncbi:cytochrome P450 [Micromonospora sp. CPCC 205711]|uniref:bifunctional cytochrome P450/NADPH--P450 reductase n=1 Tax=Micromonospora sp. CPCC 205547 TaxID=3122400 RepID=UPI002FEF1016
MSSNLTTIPAPRGVPIVGNALQIPSDGPAAFFEETAGQFPEGIYRLALPGRELVLVSDPDLVAELCDESRFYKPIEKPHSDVRAIAGDGLFTARGDEPNWGKAHRILMPAFSQRSMKSYFPEMLEVADALVGKWRRDEGKDLDVVADMTRLTLDTIGITGFDYRFDSFRSEEVHPFLQALADSLHEAMGRLKQPPFVTAMRRRQNRTFEENVRVMHSLVEEVIRERRAGGGDDRRDLLSLMLGAVDPETGEPLSDENIRNNVVTFLIAGHETTSGLLSYALYQLLRNPHVLAQAYAEVDRLLPGDTVPTYETIMKLNVIPRVLDETLRLWGPIPAIALAPYEDTVLGGRYALPKDQQVMVVIPALHKHPKAWDRPTEFDIDRWLPENIAQHHPHAYKPFGNGERACIGRQFALTEARLALALLLQNFAIIDQNDYQIKVKETLTRKPDNFMVRVRSRQPYERFDTEVRAVPESPAAAAAVNVVGVTLRVAYGSNLGASEDLARQLAGRAEQSGFDTTVLTLDELADNPPTDGILVVVTPSYNGKAPDNAQRFDALAAAGGLTADSMSKVRFAVLGNGNTHWLTYQAFPKRVEAALLAAGATSIVPRGEVDANGDFDGMATTWMNALWTALAEQYGADTSASTGPRLSLEVLTEAQVRPAVVSEKAYPITVVASEELVGDPTGLWDFSVEAPRPQALSITVELPDGVGYETGNHLAVFGKNDPELVTRALRLLRVPRDQVVRLRRADASSGAHLPIDQPVTAELLLTEFVELQEVASRTHLRALAEHTQCPWTTGQLQGYFDDTDEARRRYQDEILAKRVSVLTLLERFPAVELPLAAFLELAGPIRPRFYSISSAAMVEPNRPRLTVGLLEGPALSGDGEYRGLASQYLARLRPGDVFFGYVRVPAPPFHPPADPATPMILVGPGTGFAPLRGFLEERAAQQASGVEVGLSKVFYGCRHPEHDWFYRDEMQSWEQAGIAEVHLAFSTVPGHPHKYVQDAITADGDAIWDAIENGAHIYVCGDGRRMAPSVRQALAGIYCSHTGGSADDAEKWLDQLEDDGRYQQDVFA